ncbi:uncharacterized mitochondrial protein-like protein [Tanacetum coccineum]
MVLNKLTYSSTSSLLRNNSALIQEIKDKRHHAFNIKDLGALHYYLGIEFLRNTNGIVMTQRKVIRYIKLSPGQGLFLPRHNLAILHAYCDSDWANCPNSRRPITGFGIFLGNTLNSWHLKKQLVVSRSSTKAEYRALAYCSCEITCLISLLKDLRVFVSTLVRILCDNISIITLASNPVQHARTKHIKLDCHFVRDKIKVGQIQVSYVPTKAQVVDTFTKAPTTYPLRHCLSKPGMCDPYTLLACWGDDGIHYKVNSRVNFIFIFRASKTKEELSIWKKTYTSPHYNKHQNYLSKCSSM